MLAFGIVPVLNEFVQRGVRVAMRLEDIADQQLMLERREEILVKMLLSGLVWAAVAWIRIWEQRRHKASVGQLT